MKLYQIAISGTFHYPIMLEAKNEAEAKEEALNEFENDLDRMSNQHLNIDYDVCYIDILGGDDED